MYIYIYIYILSYLKLFDGSLKGGALVEYEYKVKSALKKKPILRLMIMYNS